MYLEVVGRKEFKIIMNRGIVTIATGDKKYYEMAKNLLISIRITNPNEKVAILTDEANEYKKLYDDVVILKNPYHSYMDKINLLKHLPYEENIFIDADSLVYDKLSDIWKEFESKTDFSCYGTKLSIGSKGGWFKESDIGEWRDKIYYIPQMHGGLYFVRKGDFIKEFYELCLKIQSNYKQYRFAYFDEPADEPILALASAILNVDFASTRQTICFYPAIEKIMDLNIYKRKLTYLSQGKCCSGKVLHFGSINTEKALYKCERDKFIKILVVSNKL